MTTSPSSRHGLFREIIRLLRPLLWVMAPATVLGAVSGLATAWLLATVNNGLHAPEGLTTGLLLQFAGLCALSIGGDAVAGIGNSIVGQKVIATLRKDISARILRAPLALVEQRRNHRLLTVLTNDVDMVSAFTFSFSGYVIALAITIGGFAYLALLSPGVFFVSAAAIAIGVAINLYSKRGWLRDYEGVRNAQDDLQKQYRAITEGAKELRLNRERSEQVHAELLSGAANRIADLKIRAMRRFWSANAANAGLFFVVIGILLAAQRPMGLSATVVSGAVLVLLYVKGPIDQAVSALPALGQAQIAFRRIAALTADFSEPESAPPAVGQAADEPMRTIELRAVRYAFPAEDGGTSFELGPIDLTLRAGEALFIVGDNGSGKTTLIKLLLGLYTPTSGAVLLNGQPLRDADLQAYRQRFSAVFADYYLFDDLLAADAHLVERARDYLRKLELGRRVQIRDGAFTTTDLSTGQRKRLALVHAYLEQRPIMMFDEWAADQDPAFRRVFYTELLPDLKRQGKTLIVISHDDRYFDAADRIVQLRDGKIVETPVAQYARA